MVVNGICCALIEKYGIVQSLLCLRLTTVTCLLEINAALNTQLRHVAVILRKLVNDGQSEEIINAKRDDMMNEIYRMLVFAFGVPVDKFNFEYRDADKNYHIDKDLT